jgi:hypothetical protein
VAATSLLATAEHCSLEIGLQKFSATAVLAVGSDFDVSIRLMLFVLMPSVIFTRDVDLDDIRIIPNVFAPRRRCFIPQAAGVSAGLPDEVLPDEVAARALVSKYAKLLTEAQRTFDNNMFVSNPCEAANFLGTICPPILIRNLKYFDSYFRHSFDQNPKVVRRYFFRFTS